MRGCGRSQRSARRAGRGGNGRLRRAPRCSLPRAARRAGRRRLARCLPPRTRGAGCPRRPRHHLQQPRLDGGSPRAREPCFASGAGHSGPWTFVLPPRPLRCRRIRARFAGPPRSAFDRADGRRRPLARRLRSRQTGRGPPRARSRRCAGRRRAGDPGRAPDRCPDLHRRLPRSRSSPPARALPEP